MSSNAKSILTLCALLCVLSGGTAAAADDDDAAAAASTASALMLSIEQQQAVGIVIAHPVQARMARQIEAYGSVLDPVTLITDVGRLESTAAAARFTAADAGRLESLYRNETNVSLKALQTAQAAEIEAQSQARAAAVNFALQWGPVAALAEGPRRKLLEALAAGQSLLVRAELPGQHVLGVLPRQAQLRVDGIGVNARVLGALLRITPDLQGAGWLLQIDRPPPGLGPGARVPVVLQDGSLQGLLVPSSSLLYGEQGAYVYREERSRTPEGKLHYAAVTVKLLTPRGEGWLVEGLDEADRVVVHGAGVLWSLQGLGTFSTEEEEHD